jgi:hypothetical protein
MSHPREEPPCPCCDPIIAAPPAGAELQGGTVPTVRPPLVADPDLTTFDGPSRQVMREFLAGGTDHRGWFNRVLLNFLNVYKMPTPGSLEDMALVSGQKEGALRDFFEAVALRFAALQQAREAAERESVAALAGYYAQLERAVALTAQLAEAQRKLDQMTQVAADHYGDATRLEAQLAEARAEGVVLLKSVAPQCEPLSTVAGIITQLNNYIAWQQADLAAATQRAEQAERDNATLTAQRDDARNALRQYDPVRYGAPHA